MPRMVRVFVSGLMLAASTAFAQGKPPAKKPAPAPAAAAPAAGEETGPAALLSRGIELYDAKKYYESADLLLQVVEDDAADAGFKQKAEFFLGKSLYNLDYLNSSLAYFKKIVEVGPDHSYHRATLKFLAALADRLPNDVPLLEYIGKYTTEDFPEKNKEELSYLLGKYQYYQNNFDAAAALLGLVTGQSEKFLDAKFYEAMVYVRLNDGKAASDALKEILRYIADAKTKPIYKERKEEIDRFEDLTELTMGRVFYSTKQFQTSIKYFDRVDIKSDFWLESLFNATWSYFQVNSFDRALGHIHTLNSPYFEGEFYPEALIVKSVILFYNCRYDDALIFAKKFEEIYKPVSEELSNYLSKFTDDDQFYSFVAKFRKGKVTLTPRIQRIISIALGDKALLKQFEQIESIDAEQKQLKIDKKRWGDAKIAQRIEEELDISKSFAATEAGAQVRERFSRVQVELKDLIRQAIKIKFEVANAQAGALEEELQRELAEAAAPVDTGNGKKSVKKNAALVVDEEHELWSFDREYWKDELGYYRSPLTSMCKFGGTEAPAGTN